MRGWSKPRPDWKSVWWPAKPETHDIWQAVSTPKDKQFRYARGLSVQPLCLTCHGDPAAIPDGVSARLATEYPLDKGPAMRPEWCAVSFRSSAQL